MSGEINLTTTDYWLQELVFNEEKERWEYDEIKNLGGITSVQRDDFDNIITIKGGKVGHMYVFTGSEENLNKSWMSIMNAMHEGIKLIEVYVKEKS